MAPVATSLSTSQTVPIKGNGSSSPHSSLAQTDYRGYDHVKWYVGNAKQAASYYVARMGFSVVAYKGLETGSKAIAGYVVANSRARFVLLSPIRGLAGLDENISIADQQLVKEMHEHLEKHGDAVKDVAFEVDDARAVYDAAASRGATGVYPPAVTKDKDGQAVTATVKTYGDTTHTFVQRGDYHGTFLPGYQTMMVNDPVNEYLPEVLLDVIDHCVGNQGSGEMVSICDL